MDKIKAISLFSSAGIGEILLKNTNIEIVAANELLSKRAECYSYFYPKANMYCGDIALKETQNHIIKIANRNNAKLLIATPPCQGLTPLGKNKKQIHFEKDMRNFLIFSVFNIIDQCSFDYILIENVPNFLEMCFPYENGYFKLEEILNKKYSDKYIIDVRVLNAKDYGICQSRPRAIIKMYKPNKKWAWPTKEAEIPLRDAIGWLPSLESGETSDIPWHFAKKHNDRAILALKHTPTGKSAITNEFYYPKKEDGTRIKGFISSHNNVHPGRLLSDGTYSDARVLTLLETFIVSSIPKDVDFPEDSSDTFIRTVIGESIPPKLMMKVIEKIGE